MQRTGIYLAPDPEQSGGHAYKADGTLGSNDKSDHTHEQKVWPTKKQTGSGRKGNEGELAPIAPRLRASFLLCTPRELSGARPL